MLNSFLRKNYRGAPHLKSFLFKVVADPNSQLAQALSGDITAEIISDTAGISRLKSASNLQIRAVTVPQFYWLSLHAPTRCFPA